MSFMSLMSAVFSVNLWFNVLGKLRKWVNSIKLKMSYEQSIRNKTFYPDVFKYSFVGPINFLQITYIQNVG